MVFRILLSSSFINKMFKYLKSLKFFVILWVGFCAHIQAQDKITDAQIADYVQRADALISKGQKGDAVFYYTKLAHHYWINSQYDNAIQYFQKALDINLEIGNNNGVAGIYSQFGAIYTDLKQFNKSAEYYAKALEYIKKLKNKRSTVDALFNYSEALANAERYNEAIKALEDAKTLCFELEDKVLKRNCMARLAEVAGKAGNNELQANYFETYKQLERELQQEKIVKAQKENEQKIGQIKQEASAIITKKDMDLKVTSEELELERNINKLRELEINNLKIQNERDQAQLREQEAKIKLQNLINISLTVGIILVTLIAFLIYRGYVEKQKANKKIQKQAEEIAHKNEELEKKNEELMELNNEKNYIIGIVAHDLKSPLNNLKGLLEVFKVKIGGLNDEQAKYHDLMMKSIDRMKGMIHRILDMSAIEQKELNINLKDMDLAELVRSVLADKVEVANNKKLSIVTQFEPKPYLAKVDGEYYFQVMENLVSNAIKFSPQNKNIYIVLKESNGHIVTEVKDEGPGIAPEDKSKLFKKFQKLSARPTGGESSTGLGLSIVKKYVEAMKGSIRCESEQGKGTSFIVELNRA